jgi:CheY-like chemotaxis protein
MRVLIVDDDPVVRDLLTAVFEGADLDISVAADGAEALRQAKKHRPDCIILDVMMPVIDGLSVCRRLREDPITSRSRIVMLSANKVRSASEWESAGADAYLPKPFGALALMDAVLGRPVRT